MFGTDQMRWPETIGMAIDVIKSTPSLTDPQRRDILYNNAARVNLARPGFSRHR
jgi:predicted TIM-barrel fold metal-dependent hydrolase